jgi:hypothetical protein
MSLRVNRSFIDSFFQIHHHHITSPILNPTSHPLSPVGFQSLKNMNLNADSGADIFVQRSKMDLSAEVDAAPLNHVNSRKMRGCMEKFVAFGDILGIKEMNAY